MVAATPELLTEKLEAVGNDLIHATAILWTWLDLHLITLGSLREKPPAIQARAEDNPQFTDLEGITDGMVEWLRENPLPRAAELLALIDVDFVSRSTSILEPTTGFNGEKVIVARRDPKLALLLDQDHDAPPTSIEHPTLSTLAPRIVVCPEVVNGIELEVLTLDPDQEAEWELAAAQLELGVAGAMPLRVYLDSLDEEGLSGFERVEDGNCKVGCYRKEKIDDAEEARCVEEAKQAVRAVEGESSILLMPELAATPPVVAAVEAELKSQNEAGTAPALTILGLYHHIPEESPELDRDLVREGELAEWVNEAVVLGPDGTELWRHRKLSSAADDEGFVEDIRLGERLRLLRTPIGIVTVVICLDAFAPHVRERVLASPAEVLFVPSLSPSIHRHRTSLEHLVQVLWGAAFVCNRGPEAVEGGTVWDEPRNRSFWAVQRRSAESSPERTEDGRPSFVFKLAEEMARGANAEPDPNSQPG